MSKPSHIKATIEWIRKISTFLSLRGFEIRENTLTQGIKLFEFCSKKVVFVKDELMLVCIVCVNLCIKRYQTDQILLDDFSLHIIHVNFIY